jgi:alkylation response protein AidB-like acyl-CoA dehydrogenase
MSGRAAPSDERRMLAESVTALLAQGDPAARCRENRDHGEGLDRALWQQMAEQGWHGILVPEDCGGLGLGLADLAVVAEGTGRAAAPEPIAAAGMAVCVLATLHRTSVEPPALTGLLAECAVGERVPALAWQATPQELDPLTPGDLRSDGIAVHGTRALVQPGPADVFLVPVTASDPPALYAVSRDADGVNVDAHPQADGTAALTLQLQSVAVDDGACLARGEVVTEALRRGAAAGAILASAELLGLADRLLAQTGEYLGTREQFGQRLSGFQVLRHRMVDLYIQRQLMTAALHHALTVAQGAAGTDALCRAASRAKARAGDGARHIAREAVQLHGAIGYTEEGGVGVALRRIQVLSAWLGNARHHRRRYLQLSRSAD